jgi:hypothetical protein
MHNSATKCNETIGKWCKNKHGASKIIDTLETYQAYLKLWMPANKGPLMISGSFARSENCDKDFNSMSQTFGVHEELNHIWESTNMDVDPPA